jgi:hypothetical protein
MTVGLQRGSAAAAVTAAWPPIAAPTTNRLGRARLARPPRPGHTPPPPPPRLRHFPRPRTSEFWYEDEEEFDSIAGDSLRPKTLTVVDMSSATDLPALAAALAPTAFDACFHSPGAADAAKVLWGPDRGGPPFFIRPRPRSTLDSDPSAAWSELAGQNWRAGGLLAGLDAGTSAAADAGEALLVVVEGSAFLCAAGLEPAPGGVTVVELSGWTGDGVAPVPEWRSLQPRVV